MVKWVIMHILPTCEVYIETIFSKLNRIKKFRILQSSNQVASWYIAIAKSFI